MALTSGTKLGPYDIQSLLGAGGMGEVYRARDARLDRIGAIKDLPTSYSADAEPLQRLVQEARAAAALNHPNILSIFDIGEEGRAPYIVSELLEGQTLRERIRSGPLSSRKAIDYALQVARGLAAAHEKGIVHRDLKPENLFFTHDDRVKIFDFGLAKLTRPETGAGAEAPTAQVNTEPGQIMGTVGYMSPEQVRGKAADHRSDIFSFGSILYEMLSGQRAFRGETPADTMSAILKEEPAELSETARNVPPALERMVRHCLEKSPARRFQSAGDLAFDLEALTDSSAGGKAGPQSAIAEAATAETTALKKEVASRSNLFGLAGALGLAAGVRGVGGPGGGGPAAAGVPTDHVWRGFDRECAIYAGRQHCVQRFVGRRRTPVVYRAHGQPGRTRPRGEGCGTAGYLKERRAGGAAQRGEPRRLCAGGNAGADSIERGSAARSAGQCTGRGLGAGRRKYGGGALHPRERPLAFGVSDWEGAVRRY